MRLAPRPVLLALGAARLGIGGFVLARPESLARMLGVDSVTARRTAWLARMVAGRELALGAGSVLAAGRPQGRRPWLIGQLMADAGDAVALVLAARARVVHPVLAAAVAASAAAAVVVEARAALE